MEEKNGISRTLLIIGIIEIVIGIIAGIVLGALSESFVTFIVWAAVSVTSGMLIIGFSEVINLLEKNYRKTADIHRFMIQNSFSTSKKSDNSSMPSDVKSVNLLNSNDTKTNNVAMGNSQTFNYRFVGMGKGNHGTLSVFNPTYISLEITKSYIRVEDINSKLFDIAISSIESLYNAEKNTLSIEYKDESNIVRKLEIIISADKYDKTAEEVIAIIKGLKS